MFARNVATWRGTRAPPAADNVQTRAQIDVDDLGNIISAQTDSSADASLLVLTSYAIS